MRALLLSAAFLAASLPAAAPAQDNGDEKVNQLIIYGNDPCPRRDDEIVVCARRPEGDRYRIPSNLRSDPNDPANQAWARTAQSLEYVGRTGTGSCSPVGGGGFTGCFAQMVREARADHAGRDDVNWNALIDQARQDRLSRIDAAAAAEDATHPPLQLPPPPSSAPAPAPPPTTPQ
jgi:hypothetical protein